MTLALPELERRVRAVLAARTDVRFAWLFGSVLTRGPAGARDLDVAVGFAGAPSLFELARISDAIEVATGMPADVVDVETASTLLRWEIVRNGRIIHRPDEAAAIDFIARVPLEWFDLEPFRAAELAGLRRVLEEQRWSAPTS